MIIPAITLLITLQLIVRLWCVFEMAAYQKVNPMGKLVLAPLFLERMLLLTIIFTYFIAFFFWSIGVGLLGKRHGQPALIIALSPAMLLIHALRRSATGRAQLLVELESFSLDTVKCSLEADRDTVLAAIDHWYGSREDFVQYVRGPLRQKLLDSASKISMSYVALMATPGASGLLEDHMALWRAGAPPANALAHLLGLVLGSYTLWIAFCLRLLISLCVFFAAKRSCLILDYLLTLMIHLIVLMTAFAGDRVGKWASVDSILFSTGWLCFTAFSLAGLMHVTRKLCQV